MRHNARIKNSQHHRRQWSVVKTLLVTAAAFLGTISPFAAGQTAYDPLATRRGWEVGGQIAHYHYEEPNFAKLIGPRAGVVGGYTLVRWGMFFRADGRISIGNLKYQGSGTQDDVPDSIQETRVVAGTDIRAGSHVAFSPYAGLGYRYLYNDLRGQTQSGGVVFAGYRRYSTYLYAPFGLTTRFKLTERWVLAPTIEYDVFLRGSQTSKLSDVGPGNSDVTNAQRHGRGYRFALMAETGRLAFGPWVHYWRIEDSDRVRISPTTVVLEPANWTREIGVEARFRF